MKKYSVTFVKQETYEVEANSLDDAEEYGLELLNDDEWAFLDNSIHQIIVEEINKSKKEEE